MRPARARRRWPGWRSGWPGSVPRRLSVPELELAADVQQREHVQDAVVVALLIHRHLEVPELLQERPRLLRRHAEAEHRVHRDEPRRMRAAERPSVERQLARVAW